MPNDLTHVYVPFADVMKSTIKGADGKEVDVRIIRGLMTDESLDLDDQRVDYDWAKQAATKWHSRWGNIREQHTSNAIGKSVELANLDDARAIDLTSKVVGAEAIVKVDERILQGYSVGIKGARVVKDATAPNGRIVGGEIIEVSLVDHPANENCKVALVKSAKSGELEDAEQAVVEKDPDADAAKDSVIDDLVADIDGLNKPNTNPPKKRGTAADGSSRGEQLEVTPDSAVTRRKKKQPTSATGKGIEADLEKANTAPTLDGENSQHNKPIKAAIEAVRTLLQQEVAEPSLDFQDVTWIARVGWDLVCWAADEAWEDAASIYMAVMPDIEKNLAAGDRKAAIAALRAADSIAKAAKAKTTKEAPSVEPEPEPAVETSTLAETTPEVTTPPATETEAAKQAIADSEKSNASEVITKAVEAAVKPLRDEIEKLKEKRAAPGGPILGASKLLSAPSEVKAAVIQASLEDLKKAAEEHPDYSVREGARQMLAKLAGEPATV